MLVHCFGVFEFNCLNVFSNRKSFSFISSSSYPISGLFLVLAQVAEVRWRSLNFWPSAPFAPPLAAARPSLAQRGLAPRPLPLTGGAPVIPDLG
jgi:hypothetical protein